MKRELSLLTMLGTPKQSGLVESKNQTLLEMVKSMMTQAKLLILY